MIAGKIQESFNIEIGQIVYICTAIFDDVCCVNGSSMIPRVFMRSFHSLKLLKCNGKPLRQDLKNKNLKSNSRYMISLK